jgi:ABC-type phosphate transport system substrate-binding protein
MAGMKADALAAVVIAAAIVGTARSGRGADEFVVIVNPSVTGSQMHRRDLASLFLKKATHWGDRSVAVPVDQSGVSAVRHAFCEAVLDMPVATVLQYWQKQAFGATPVRPPVVKTSDWEVVAFVAETKGAVGYVSSTLPLPPTVKVIAVME